jgi:FAD/FMN-containing dehydrogenase
MPGRVLTFAPKNAEEAAAVFRAASAAAEAGGKIRAWIAESPFKTAVGNLRAVPSSIEEIVRTAGSSGDGIARSEGTGETLVLLTSSAMNEIYEISKKDFLAVAGGGVAFGAFVEAVRSAGLYFPHEPDAARRDATIAEIIMAGASFRTDGRYGRLREYLLSLELVTPGGDIIRTGSRSVKDVTGYDIAGFLMGQGGLCGLIARATIRLLPPPGTRLVFMCEGERGALEALAAEIRRRLSPAFVEMLGAAGRAEAAAGSPAGGNSNAAERLVGEIQSAVRGREEALLADLAELASDGVRVTRLERSALAEILAKSAGPRESGARAGSTTAATGSGARGDGTDASGDKVTEELTRRLLRVFDPQGIMLP